MILSIEVVESGGLRAGGAGRARRSGRSTSPCCWSPGGPATGSRTRAITILEKVFGTLLVAIGVQLALVGAVRLGDPVEQPPPY